MAFSSTTPTLGLNDPKRYEILRLIGQGSFGKVYEAKDRMSEKTVAIKKIDVDEDAEKELGVNLEVSHPNAIALLGHYVEERADAPLFQDLCLVLEFGGITLDGFIKEYRMKQERISPVLVQLLSFQMFRVVHYLHSKLIIHRDIKPSNFLINPSTCMLKISDFGSSKRLVSGEAMSAGVCSEPYRPPEVELGKKIYDAKIDIWSAGCVVAECATGEVLFNPVEEVKHIDIIRALLGDPTPEDVAELQPMKSKLPIGPPCPPTWEQHFGKLHQPLAPSTIEFVKKLLQYRPSKRPSAIEVLADDFHDPLRQTRGYEKMLYEFFEKELDDVAATLLERIVPPEHRNAAVAQRLRQQNAQAHRQNTTQPPKETMGEGIAESLKPAKEGGGN